MSESHIDHAEEERLSVFAKYDKGREEGAKIDDWEDPALELFHVTDRYGFIHDHVVPRLKEEVKRANKENQRSDKWLEMTRPEKWGKGKLPDKLRERTYKGIPNKLRGRVWGLFLNLQTIKEQQKGKYKEMYELARKYSPDVRQIDLDVNRTYRDTLMFRQRYGLPQKSLFNILCAYSVYNSEVGYCQGMSQIAALLLMYLTEEDAFWGLAQLMTHNKWGMHGFFIAGFPKLVRFQAHHDRVLQVMLPKLKRHFDKHGVDSGLYTLKWFFQCFLDRVPFELSLRLWDIFLLEGDRVLICGAYAILKIHQKQLLARKNMDEILNYIQSTIPTNFGIDNDKAIEDFWKYSDDLQSKKLARGGEAGDDELPKKPFGIIEHIPTPVPREDNRVSKEIETRKEQRASLATEEVMDDEEDQEISGMDKASTSRASITATSVTSTSIDDSPRNVGARPVSSISNVSYVSAKADTMSNGPSEHSTPVKMNGMPHKSQSMVTSTPKNPTNEKRHRHFEDEYDYEDSRTSEVILTATRTETQTKTMEISVEEEMEVTRLLAELESFEKNNSNHSPASSSHRSQSQASSYSQNRSQLPIFKKKSPSPPPPPPRSPSNIQHDVRSSSSSHNHSSRGSPDSLSEFGRGGRKKVPPPVNPRRSLMTATPPSTENNIPGVSNNEAVRIHVPYTIPSPTHQPQTTQVVSPRNGYDSSKPDPNRIILDISSHPTLIQ